MVMSFEATDWRQHMSKAKKPKEVSQSGDHPSTGYQERKLELLARDLTTRYRVGVSCAPKVRAVQGPPEMMSRRSTSIANLKLRAAAGTGTGTGAHLRCLTREESRLGLFLFS